MLVFVGQAWQLGLVALRRQRALAFANGVALVVVLVAGVILIPPFGAVGAAIAAVAAEAALAGTVLYSIKRLEPALMPRGRFAPRVLADRGSLRAPEAPSCPMPCSGPASDR